MEIKDMLTTHDLIRSTTQQQPIKKAPNKATPTRKNPKTVKK